MYKYHLHVRQQYLTKSLSKRDQFVLICDLFSFDLDEMTLLWYRV